MRFTPLEQDRRYSTYCEPTISDGRTTHTPKSRCCRRATPANHVIRRNVTGDKNAERQKYPVIQVIQPGSRRSGRITFSMSAEETRPSFDLEGQVLTTWPDYRAKVHMKSADLGNHTATFPGMLRGRPMTADTGNWSRTPESVGSRSSKLMARRLFFSAHTNDEVFANGLPSIISCQRSTNKRYHRSANKPGTVAYHGDTRHFASRTSEHRSGDSRGHMGRKFMPRSDSAAARRTFATSP